MGVAPSLNLVEPVLGLAEPIAVAFEDSGAVAEIVGADAHDHKLGPHPLAILAERVVILFG